MMVARALAGRVVGDARRRTRVADLVDFRDIAQALKPGGSLIRLASFCSVKLSASSRFLIRSWTGSVGARLVCAVSGAATQTETIATTEAADKLWDRIVDAAHVGLTGPA
jgi:hypothetical protein